MVRMCMAVWRVCACATVVDAQFFSVVIAAVPRRKVEDGEALRAKAGDNTANIIPIILDVTKKEQIDDSYNTVKEHVQKRNVSKKYNGIFLAFAHPLSSFPPSSFFIALSPLSPPPLSLLSLPPHVGEACCCYQ